MFSRLLSRAFRKVRKPVSAPRPRRARPEIEAFEDRVVPAVINVNSLSDVLNPAPGVVTLRSAIQQANTDGDATNTINLTVAGTYKITLAGTAGETDNQAGEFAILPTAGNLTIQNTSGGNVTMDGNHLNRVFDINTNFDPNNPTAKFLVTFQGFTITNGVATDINNPDGPNATGGGIRDIGNASLTLNNVVVTNNTADADGGGIGFENTVSVPWTLTVNNSTISNNHAGDAGGGIDTDGSGKIFINAGSVITGNTTVNQGAGIWLDAIQAGTVFQTANLTIDGATISNNSALTGLGGGLGNAGNGTVTITNSSILNNYSGATGGGFSDENAQGTLVVQNSLFQGNTAVGQGGGIFVASPSTTISNSEILGNYSATSGGGVAATGTTISITSSELDNNSSGGSGGAVFANGTTLTVLDSTVADNSVAGNGGGFEIETTGTGLAASAITNSTITANRSLNANGGNIGGGIDFGNAGTFSGAFTLLNDTINANFAFSGGGIAMASGGTVNIENTIIAGNQVENEGQDFVTTNNTQFTSLGGNLVGINSGNSPFTQGTDQIGTFAAPLDPLLGTLGNNGGPTLGPTGSTFVLETEALLTGSPATGKGVKTGAPTTDERGFNRPATTGGNVSIGAFEPQPAPPPTTPTQPTLTPNQLFVQRVYQSLLGRPADAGSAAWVNLLNQGVSPTNVVLGIESSNEYRGDVVQGLYQRYLHRQADAGGLQSFVNLLAGGQTVEQVTEAIVGSNEYFQLHGGTNSGFINGLFNDALGRNVDPSGLSSLSQLLAGGASRTSAAAVVFTSQEYQTDLIMSDYQLALGRSADAGGLASFVNALHTRTTDQVVLAELFGSPEGFAKGT
jgi:hypothetical protein